MSRWLSIATLYRERKDLQFNGKHIVLNGLKDGDLFGRIFIFWSFGQCI
jgi:hypothetical protein